MRRGAIEFTQQFVKRLGGGAIRERNKVLHGARDQLRMYLKINMARLSGSPCGVRMQSAPSVNPGGIVIDLHLDDPYSLL